MTINIQATSLKNRLDAANPNALPDMLRVVKIGSVLRALPTFKRRFNFNTAPADAFVLGTLQAMALPDDAKACTIVRATAMSAAGGGGTAGELTIDAYGTTPVGGHIAVAPNGDIVALASDKWTSVDVVYQPEKLDVVEVIGAPVAANVLTLPALATTPGVVLLMECTATAAGSAGAKIPLVPGSGAPAAGQCRLNLAKTTVTFAGADAVTAATVKLGLVPGTDLDALLTAITNLG